MTVLNVGNQPLSRAEAARQRFLALQDSAARPRPTDNLTGKEVITRSSNKPVILRPPLETTPMALYRHRSDTHTRVAHGISNVFAHATGFLDGIVDSLANGTGELFEDGAFFVSKVVHGATHGWARGKFPNSQSQ
jgi:hypothetical protein